MKIDEFLNAMNNVDASALMDLANRVTTKVNLELIDTLMTLSRYGWEWTGGPSYD